MSIVVFLLVGLVAGLLARAIMPGRQQISLPLTALLGVVGSFVGGFLLSLVSGQRRILDFSTTGIIGSVIGALVVLLVYTQVVARRRI
jgi:uncharacterized membrane protein YeaQ/YmgE (transglycosylase-associated protein family)